MGIFLIDAENLRWTDGSQDDPEDLCLHGDAVVHIGTRKLEYADTTVSATALYLLKTLTEDHIIGHDNQMLPCCGHMILPAANGSWERVVICGCPYGVDWTVRHEENTVIAELEDGTREYIPLAEYQKEVFRFADQIERFYQSCSPKKLPADSFECDGYRAFWEEWHRRRGI